MTLNLTPPASILIIGSGVFGLSIAHELAINPRYKQTKLTLIDRLPFPAPDAASIDTSRIIRADYPDAAYAALAARAQHRWRTDWGADGRYHETGFVLTGEKGKEPYLLASYENVKAINRAAAIANNLKENPDDVQWLGNQEEIKAVTGTSGASGDFGYLNRRSGWADAEATMRWLRSTVEQTGRVEFITGRATRLLFDTSGTQARVLGATYIPYESESSNTASERQIHAESTILATGSWSSTLLHLTGHAKTTAQSLAYVPLSDAQAAQFSNIPIQINMSSGYFMIPPPPPEQHINFPGTTGQPGQRRLSIKLARHEHGYANPAIIDHPEPHITTSASLPPVLETSVPVPSNSSSPDVATHAIPPSAFSGLQRYLETILPSSPELVLDPSKSRLCHYNDTPTGNFIFAYHPRYSNHSLFVATGGSGHAFKFAPVLGEAGVQCFEGRCPPGFEEKWAWKEAKVGEWFVDDGSRGGEKGLTL